MYQEVRLRIVVFIISLPIVFLVIQSILYLLTNGKDMHILYKSIKSKGDCFMPKVSAKRQITLPVDQCRQAHIEPGDEYNSYVDNNGYITIIKSTSGAAKGVLRGIKVDKRLSDGDSLQSALDS